MTDQDSGGLTDKQRAFVSEYLIDLNAAQAAIRAGYSKKTARQIGSENLSKPVIQSAIAKARKAQSERNEITVDGLIKQLVEDHSFARSKGNPSAAVRATELLGKHVGMFNKEQIDHTIKGPLVIIRTRKEAKEEGDDRAPDD